VSDYTLSRISKSDNWATPEAFYKKLDAEFHFNDDACPLGGEGGLTRRWGSVTFLNPPYSAPLEWVKKACMESKNYGVTVVGLLRGDTSTRWFHDWVLPFAELRFVRGRIKFNGKPAPFASILAIWKGEQP
jgi:hypothetical protein